MESIRWVQRVCNSWEGGLHINSGLNSNCFFTQRHPAGKDDFKLWGITQERGREQRQCAVWLTQGGIVLWLGQISPKTVVISCIHSMRWEMLDIFVCCWLCTSRCLVSFTLDWAKPKDTFRLTLLRMQLSADWCSSIGVTQRFALLLPLPGSSLSRSWRYCLLCNVHGS